MPLRLLFVFGGFAGGRLGFLGESQVALRSVFFMYEKRRLARSLILLATSIPYKFGRHLVDRICSFEKWF